MVQTTGLRHNNMRYAPVGAEEISTRATFFIHRPCRGELLILYKSGGLHHRLISNVPPAQRISTLRLT